MKTYLAAAAVLVGVVAGGVAVQGPRAQTKVPVYYVVEVDVTDPLGYEKEYLSQARELIRSHGGRLLAAGDPTLVVGDPPKSRVAVYVWDDMDQLRRWFSSPAFQDLRRTGQRYARFRNYAVAGTAP